MNSLSLKFKYMRKIVFHFSILLCVWVLISWVVQQEFISVLQQKSTDDNPKVSDFSYNESAFILTVLAEVYSTVFLCHSSCYNEYEGLSRFFCFTGIMLYRLCFGIMDYFISPECYYYPETMFG